MPLLCGRLLGVAVQSCAAAATPLAQQLSLLSLLCCSCHGDKTLYETWGHYLLHTCNTTTHGCIHHAWSKQVYETQLQAQILPDIRCFDKTSTHRKLLGISLSVHRRAHMRDTGGSWKLAVLQTVICQSRGQPGGVRAVHSSCPALQGSVTFIPRVLLVCSLMQVLTSCHWCTCLQGQTCSEA